MITVILIIEICEKRVVVDGIETTEDILRKKRPREKSGLPQ